VVKYTSILFVSDRLDAFSINQIYGMNHSETTIQLPTRPMYVIFNMDDTCENVAALNDRKLIKKLTNFAKWISGDMSTMTAFGYREDHIHCRQIKDSYRLFDADFFVFNQSVIEFEDYVFKVYEDEGGNRIARVILTSNKVANAEGFWTGVLGMTKVNESLMYGARQCKIQFKAMHLPVHEQGLGRIGFAAPKDHLESLKDKVNTAGGKWGGKIKTRVTNISMSGGKVELQILYIKDGVKKNQKLSPHF